MAEKTEKATPKKLRDARKKGQVAKSQDLPSAFTFIVSIWLTLGAVQFIYDKLSAFLVSLFLYIPHLKESSTLFQFYQDALMVIFITSIPVMAAVAFVGVVVNFLAVGPVFAPEVFKFDIKKFNPVQNLKAKFKLKTLVELLKSVIKISIACYIIYDVVYNSLGDLVKAASMPMISALVLFSSFLKEVVLKIGLFFIAVAVADFAYQKMNFAKEMKMEKFEVKQEYKNTEGDPQIKSKRRQIAQEIAYQEGPAGAARRAQALVTNPTELAIALGYVKGLDAAPYILGMGEGFVAQQMVIVAKKHGVPVVRNIRLARELYEKGELHEYVPESTFPAIAEILRWIQSLGSEDEDMVEAAGKELEELNIDLSTDPEEVKNSVVRPTHLPPTHSEKSNEPFDDDDTL